MTHSDSILERINSLEQWLSDTKGDYGTYPLRLAGFVGLAGALMVSNTLALIRWPFAALLRKTTSGDVEPGRVAEVDEASLDRIVASGERVLVDFWAEWCGPCLMMNEPLKRVAEDAGADCAIVKVDTVRHPSIARKYGVKGLPTLILFDGSEEVKRHAGALSMRELKAFIAR